MVLGLGMWGLLLVMSLVVLVKGADSFIEAAEKIGKALKFSPFVIGVLLVGIGTSLPEFASSIAALFTGNVEIITANAVGSNITNILLIVGILAVLAKKFVIKQDLLASELSLFVVSTSLFIGVAFDGVITMLESTLLAIAFLIYLFYILLGNSEDAPAVAKYKAEISTGKVTAGTIAAFVIGLGAVLLGARFLIESVVAISDILNIGTGVIAITIIALGTSLPELFVSLSALRGGSTEVAIGNIFGSNAFNLLFAVGIPGIFGHLVLDPTTLHIGIPILAVASFIFVISGIAKRIYRWEGLMFLVYYAFFVIKVIGF
ncbi:MAG: calcium/sodium antiporter [Patescibacteria group bacterium UBA2103]